MSEPDFQYELCTKDLQWCAVPYGEEKYIIIHQGSQVRLCHSIITAQKFIQSKNKLCT